MGNRTTYTDGVAPAISAAWLNDLNNINYNLLGPNNGNAPTTAAGILTILQGVTNGGTTLTSNKPVVGNGTNSVKTVSTLDISLIANYLQGFYITQVVNVSWNSGSQILTLTPDLAMTAYTYGFTVLFTMTNNTNTGATTVNVSGVGSTYIQRDGNALIAGDLQPNKGYWLVCDGTGFQLMHITNMSTPALLQQGGTGVTTGNGLTLYGTASGTNTQAITTSPIAPSYYAGMRVQFKATGTNTGATNANVSSLGAKAIQIDGAALTGGEIHNGSLYVITYDGTQFQLSHQGYAGNTVAWTPAVTIGGSSATLSVALGTYTRVGNYIFYTVQCTLSSKNSHTGTVIITGFPFTVNNDSSNGFPLSVNGLGISDGPATGYVCGTCYGLPNTTSLQPTKTSTTGSGSSVVADTDISNTSVIYSSGIIRI